MKIINKKYDISSKLNKKIVLISDIHYYCKKDIKHLNKVLENINEIKPNYICIPGDLLDFSNILDLNLFIDWLKKLSSTNKVIITLGNHEFYANKRKKEYKLNSNYIDQIKKIKNLYFLKNENKIIDNINFIGLELSVEHYMCDKESEETFCKYLKYIKPKENLYNVLLCHSPINLTKEKVLDKINVDLVLCGHMHGGVVPNSFRFLFRNMGLISPQKKIFPKNAYGHIKIKDKNIIITSGIKVLSESHFPLLKNVFSSEIVEINL